MNFSAYFAASLRALRGQRLLIFKLSRDFDSGRLTCASALTKLSCRLNGTEAQPPMNAKSPLRKTGLRQKAQLMSASEIERTLVRLAYEIVEKNGGVDGLGLVGIRRRGVPIAQRLGKIIARIEKAKVPVGTLDITFYRDDLSTLGPKPVVQEKEIGFEIEDKNIVLVDDVLYTGRTTRAALDALFSHGRPRRVQLCVLIDRGHREIPVEATFVGRNVQTTDTEVIEVKLTEIDEAEKVLLMEK
jgi:pyrimidine operon attenuation protein / uracil phosphoribosyltransferase